MLGRMCGFDSVCDEMDGREGRALSSAAASPLCCMLLTQISF